MQRPWRPKSTICRTISGTSVMDVTDTHPHCECGGLVGAPISGCCTAMAPNFSSTVKAPRSGLRWPDSSTLEDAATYLLGPVLGFVLRLRGITCLHASAVAVGDRAIALMGPANAGKSTTAAGFSRMGFPVLADDIVALSEPDEILRVQPAYPQLRLWPESAAFLYGSADALPRLTPTWDKRALDLTQNGCRFQCAAIAARGHLRAGRALPRCGAEHRRASGT